MNTGAVCAVAALALALVGSSLCAAAEPRGRITVLEHGAANTSQLRDIRLRRMTVRQLTGLNVLTLRGTDGSATAIFGGRADELVTKIVLRLRYSHSPALLFAQSHLRVLLNDETVVVIPLSKETASRLNERVIELDPRFVGDLNQLRFQFVGHYATGCEDLLNSSLWAEVSGTSELEITSHPIRLPSDLAMLPEPFFDRRDLSRLRLPFVFPQDPSLDMVRAGGVVASWFGQLADWRGARFTVSLGAAVRGHAVVFATNSRRPKFLAAEAPVQGPTLRVATNPFDGVSKLLLVLGRDDADLRAAVAGLVRGTAALSGAETRVRAVAESTSYTAYDVPGWVRRDRPTRLGELVARPEELQALGHTPAVIRVGLRVPPDLFLWRSPGVPLDLKFRHNAVATPGEGPSRLTVGINGLLLRSFELEPGGGASVLSRMRVSFLDARAQRQKGGASVPPFALGARSELQLAFNFPVPKEGACRDSYVQNIGGSIDPDSTIDFSGFPHYTALPHLGYFATSGFPFTRYANLAQTIVIVPPAPDAHEIETFITLMGRMGESTHAPVTAVRLLPPVDPAEYRDADLLMIGTAARLKLLDRWQAHLPAQVDGLARRLSLPASPSGPGRNYFSFGGDSNAGPTMRAEVLGAGPVAALIGFESPVTPKRSVVLVTADTTASLAIALDSLEDTGLVRAMEGSIVLMHAKKVYSYQVGHSYFVGELPLWTWLWYRAAAYPLTLAVLGLVAALILAIVTWRALRGIARRRLGGAS